MSDPLGKIERMNPFQAPLTELHSQLRAVVQDAATGGGVQGMSDPELAGMLAETAGLARLVEALLIDAVGEVARRSETCVIAERMTSRLGCHDVPELVERVTRVSRATASRWRRAAKAVRPAVATTTGELLPAEMPEVRAAMIDGVLGVDGILAIATPLSETAPRVMPNARRAAEHILVAEARGEGPDGSPPLSADLLRLQAVTWATALDQDGAEPRERAAMRKRSLRLGAPDAYGVPVRGHLLHEVAAQLQLITDAQLSPRVTFENPDTDTDGDTDTGADSDTGEAGGPIPLRDTRTRVQKQHDALAMALSVAASSGLLPTIGGAAPTLIVSITEPDLQADTGYAHAQACTEPVPVGLARRIACTGVIQRITNGADGRILRIGIEDRVFNRHQRRAIALRDGGCIIPGCSIPAGWCEIHHVTAHAAGGPTHTDNGVLLCWYHHRFLDTTGWEIRMNHGTPEVRAPGWHTDNQKWRPVTTSPLRLRTKALQTTTVSRT